MNEDTLLAIVKSKRRNLRDLARIATDEDDIEHFFRGADFSGTDLRGEDLSGCDLTGSNFSHALIDYTTKVDEPYRKAAGVDALGPFKLLLPFYDGLSAVLAEYGQLGAVRRTIPVRAETENLRLDHIISERLTVQLKKSDIEQLNKVITVTAGHGKTATMANFIRDFERPETAVMGHLKVMFENSPKKSIRFVRVLEGLYRQLELSEESVILEVSGPGLAIVHGVKYNGKRAVIFGGSKIARRYLNSGVRAAKSSDK